MKRSTNKTLVLLLFFSAGKTCFMEGTPSRCFLYPVRLIVSAFNRVGAVDELYLTVGAVGDPGEVVAASCGFDSCVYPVNKTGYVAVNRIDELLNTLFVELLYAVGKRQRTVAEPCYAVGQSRSAVLQRQDAVVKLLCAGVQLCRTLLQVGSTRIQLPAAVKRVGNAVRVIGKTGEELVVLVKLCDSRLDLRSESRFRKRMPHRSLGQPHTSSRGSK